MLEHFRAGLPGKYVDDVCLPSGFSAYLANTDIGVAASQHRTPDAGLQCRLRSVRSDGSDCHGVHSVSHVKQYIKRRPSLLWLQGSKLFDRKEERAALMDFFAGPPTAILVLLGPRSSGKTALLQDVLSNWPLGSFPPCYLNGRARQLSDAKVLISTLQDRGAKALARLSELSNFAAVTAQENLDADTFSIGMEDMVKAFLQGQSQSMNDVITLYDAMLRLYRSKRPPGSAWPIICIDEADVLTQWQHGSLEKREALQALLNYFIMVGRSVALFGVTA